MLAVVQDEEQPTRSQRLREPLNRRPAGVLLYAKGRRHLCPHLRRVHDGTQVDEPDPVRELVLQAPCHLGRHPGFANPAWPRHRYQPVLRQQPCHLGGVMLPAHETRQWCPDVPRATPGLLPLSPCHSGSLADGQFARFRPATEVTG